MEWRILIFIAVLYGLQAFIYFQFIAYLKTTKFYKPNMKNNLNNMIDTLLGQGAINEPETGSYALTQATLEELQTKLQP